MDAREIKGILVEKTSKAGNKYICVEFKLTDSYTAVWFPSKSELELIKQLKENNTNSSYSDTNVFEQFK